MSPSDPGVTARTRQRYNRISPFYDFMEMIPERLYLPWRKEVWSQVEGPKVLEIGVGTGKNIPHYPPSVQITAIDLAPGMLARARKQAENLHHEIDLREGDAQALEFSDESFDTVVATFVFCSVPDPILGLQEARRVLRPGGKLFLLEHVRSNLLFLGPLMDLVNPLVVNTMGPNINRRTLENVRIAGLEVVKVEDLDRLDIYKLIRARRSD